MAKAASSGVLDSGRNVSNVADFGAERGLFAFAIYPDDSKFIRSTTVARNLATRNLQIDLEKLRVPI